MGHQSIQFCTRQSINHKHMDPLVVQPLVRDTRRHLKCACRLYRKQIGSGKFFLHEHPATASSWKMPGIKRVMGMNGVGTTATHQSMLSLATACENGEPMLAKKPTTCMSNSPCMLLELTRCCNDYHKHQQLTAGRTNDAEHYLMPPHPRYPSWHAQNFNGPQERERGNRSGLGCHHERRGAQSNKHDSHDDRRRTPSSITNADGGKFTVECDPANCKTCYFDESTGEPLPQDLVRQAIASELSYVNKWVWEAMKIEEAKRSPDHKRFRTRWALCNTGDDASPDARATCGLRS